jgi:HTH-type transcriptional regulator/antitoxin HigA
MILSDRQYNSSRAELEKLRISLASSGKTEGPDAWVEELNREALLEQIAEIELDIAEYDLLKSGQILLTEMSSLAELPRALIQARIARGLSQTDLAERLNMKPQQVQRYESSDYMSASLARLIEIAEVLDVKIFEMFESTKSKTSGAIFTWNDATEVVWSRFPVREMFRRKWLSPEQKNKPIEAVREFFLSSAGPQFATALHKKKVRAGSIPNEYALLAWQARVLQCARFQLDEGALRPFELNDLWLPELVSLTRDEKGPQLAQELLATRGISLVIEPHLSGTHLDGAAMMTDFGNPLIALTLRHDRLDNFWFVLFHELGHVLLHLFDNSKYDFFDEEDGSETDPIEGEADRFALNTLIPEDKWDLCLSRFAMTAEAVRLDAQRLGIDESIIAGRIRKERNNYLILNELVGQKEVRIQFEETNDAG